MSAHSHKIMGRNYTSVQCHTVMWTTFKHRFYLDVMRISFSQMIVTNQTNANSQTNKLDKDIPTYKHNKQI